ncbi:hypothetical protein [Viridibacillus arvi]
MDDSKNKWGISKAKTIFYLLFGASIGAIIGIIAYNNNWLG